MTKSVLQAELEKIIGAFVQKELVANIKPIFDKRYPRQPFPSQSSISRYITGESPIRRDILECIFEAYPLSELDRSRLLTAAGYSSDQAEEIRSTALQKLILVLTDDALPEDVKENIQRDVEAVIDGWQTYTQIEFLNHQRKWPEANQLYTDKAQVITSALSRLPQYLKAIHARSLSHLYPERNLLQLLEDDVATKLSDEDVHYSALFHATQGSLFRNEGSVERAIDNFNDAIKRFKQLELPERVQKIERKKAILYLIRGDWNKAEAPLKRCLDFFTEQENSYELARTHYDLGWVYNLSGDWDRANDYNKKGLELARLILATEQSGQTEEDLDRSAFQFLELLGLSFQGNDARQKGHLQDALNFYNKAEAILEHLPDKREEGWVFLGKARVYAQLAQYFQIRNEQRAARDSLRAAREYFDRAVASGESAKYYYRLAMAQTHYARFLLNQGEEHAATELIEEAITSAGRANAFYYLNQAKVVACEIYRFQKQFDRVQWLIREIQKGYDEHHFDRLMARVRVIEAGMALEQQSIDKAAVACAHALHHALAYNQPTVEEIRRTICDEVSQALKENLLSQESVQSFYGQVAEHLSQELKSHPLFYDSTRSAHSRHVMDLFKKYSRTL